MAIDDEAECRGDARVVGRRARMLLHPAASVGVGYGSTGNVWTAKDPTLEILWPPTARISAPQTPKPSTRTLWDGGELALASALLIEVIGAGVGLVVIDEPCYLVGRLTSLMAEFAFAV